jgi:hypothetical protein
MHFFNLCECLPTRGEYFMARVAILAANFIVPSCFPSAVTNAGIIYLKQAEF